MGEICTKKGWSGIVKSKTTLRGGKITGLRKGKTLVLGLGNTILSDDGVGIYVAREVGKHIQDSDVVVKEACVGGLELLELMKGFDSVILIDAMAVGNYDIGTLVKLRFEDLAGGSAMARHQVSFHEALQLGRELNMDLPENILIYGIKVKDSTTFGESCTPEVRRCIPRIVDQIIRDELITDDEQTDQI